MLELVFIIPGLIVAYALILRPFLHKIPALQVFYAESDGFWAKVWACCGKSVTVAWGYLLGALARPWPCSIRSRPWSETPT
jgi:hypothetical protein